MSAPVQACFEQLQPYSVANTPEKFDVLLQALCTNIAAADHCIPESTPDVFISTFIPQTERELRRTLPKHFPQMGKMLEKAGSIAFHHPEWCSSLTAARLNIKPPLEQKKKPVSPEPTSFSVGNITSIGALSLFGLIGEEPEKDNSTTENGNFPYRFGREILGNTIKAYRYVVEGTAHAQNNQFAYNLARQQNTHHPEFPGFIGQLYGEKGLLSRAFHTLFFPDKISKSSTKIENQKQLDISGSKTFKNANQIFNIEYYARNALNIYALWEIWLQHSDKPLSNNDIALTGAISSDTISNFLNLRFNAKEALANQLALEAAKITDDLAAALEKAQAANQNFNLAKTFAQHASFFQSLAGAVRLFNEFSKDEDKQSLAVKVIATGDVLSGGVWAALYRHAQVMAKARMTLLTAEAANGAILEAVNEANNILKGTFVRTLALRASLATLNIVMSSVQFGQAYNDYIDARDNTNYDSLTREGKMESAKSYMWSAVTSFIATCCFIFGGSTPIGLVLLAGSLLFGVLGSLEDPQFTEPKPEKK